MTERKVSRVSDASWLEAAAIYFENRPTNGEDAAHWANVANAERCRSIALALRSSVKTVVPTPDEVLDAADDYAMEQYGIGFLSHPRDRQRILSAIEAPAAASEAQEMSARISSLEEENKRLEAELKKQMHRATNAEYMGWAYRSMLGEKGQQVAKAWDEKGVKRVHHSWGPDAAAMTGEERAQTLLDWEDALNTAVPVETVDGGTNG